eukprot:GHVU01133858.1.p1 GENE.GHVU01133858.1~~GHVU01133858.1.p1  ORF type:complete len:109 (-),score=13.67 GHVU01133858.1:40-366(-)
MFEGAQARTRRPRRVKLWMSAHSVVVFPVPGGPWMQKRSGAQRPRRTAAIWGSLRPPAETSAAAETRAAVAAEEAEDKIMHPTAKSVVVPQVLFSGAETISMKLCDPG